MSSLGIPPEFNLPISTLSLSHQNEEAFYAAELIYGDGDGALDPLEWNRLVDIGQALDPRLSEEGLKAVEDRFIARLHDFFGRRRDAGRGGPARRRARRRWCRFDHGRGVRAPPSPNVRGC